MPSPVVRFEAGFSGPRALQRPPYFKPPETAKGSECARQVDPQNPGSLLLEPVEDFPLLRSKFNLANTKTIHPGTSFSGQKRRFTKIPPVGGPHEGARPHPLPAEMGPHRGTSEPGNSQRLGRRRGRPARAWESNHGGSLGV